MFYQRVPTFSSAAFLLIPKNQRYLCAESPCCVQFGLFKKFKLSLSDLIVWGFPEIGVPPVLIHFSGIFHEINHPAMGVPHLWKPPYGGLEGS